MIVALGGAASAQELPVPPVRQVIDANGVDLMSGQFSLQQSDIDIGPPEARLAYTRAIATSRAAVSSFGYRASTDIFLKLVDGSPDVSVTIGGSTEVFTRTGSFTYTAKNGMGSTLVFDSASSNHIYTLRDGTEVRFPGNVSTEDLNGLRALSVRRPDGLFTEYFIKPLTAYPLPPISRIQSVINNAGYQLKLEYGNGSFESRPIKVSVINRALAYCDPNADTCTAASSAPSATLAWNGSQLTATDAVGQQTRWTLDAGAATNSELYGPSAMKSKAAAADDLTAAFVVYGTGPLGTPVIGVSSVTRRGSTWTYQILDYDTNTPTVRGTDPLGYTREVKTDVPNLQVVSDKDELGRVTSYQYDSFGRRTRITYPEGNYIQITYDGRGNVTETRRVAKSGVSAPDIVESAVYPTICTNQRTCNKPSSTTDARGFTTDYTYDPVHGGLLTVTQPAPFPGAVRPQVRYTYTPLYAWYKNSSGTLVQAATPIYKLTSISACRTIASCVDVADEVRTTFTYETGSSSVPSNLLLTSVTQRSGDGALSMTTTFGYDDRGNQVSADGPLAGSADTTTTRYDGLRRVTGVISPDPDGTGPLKRRAIRQSYNADDQPLTVDTGTVEGLTETQWLAFLMLERRSFQYDTAGRRLSVAAIGAGSTVAISQFSYDAAGRLDCAAVRMNPATFTDLPVSACSHATVGKGGPDRITRTSYDPKGRVAKIQTGYGTASPRDDRSITYTVNGNIHTVTDARNNVTTYEYDEFDRLKKTRFPSSSGASSSSDFEELGYDVAGNVTQKRLRDGQSIIVGYDALGRLQTRDLPGSDPDTGYGYDNLGHVTSIVRSGQTLTFGYDALGLLRTQTGPHGTLTSDYDAAGRRTHLTWPDSFFVQYDYLLTGEMTKVRENGALSGVGLLATYDYDDLGHRTALTRGNGTSSSYWYDSASRLEQMTQDLASTSADQTVGFGYNPAYQISARTSSNDAYTWADDPNGVTGYSANSLNQYSAVGSAVPTYDARGNLTAIGTDVYGYSSDNQLTSGSGSVSLSYDPAGRLYQTSSTSGTLRFGYDGDRLVAEYNASNQLQRRYVHGARLDEPLVWYEGAGTTTRRWLHADERGSIVAISNETGTPVAINRFDEHGRPAAANIGRFQFTGQAWLPEAKLYYFKARFYSPSIGRFLQTDPIGLVGGMNLYAYVGGDPINRVDPTGLIEEIVVSASRFPDWTGYLFPNIQPSFWFPRGGIFEDGRASTEGVTEEVVVTGEAETRQCSGSFFKELMAEYGSISFSWAGGRLYGGGLSISLSTTGLDYWAGAGVGMGSGGSVTVDLSKDFGPASGYPPGFGIIFGVSGGNGTVGGQASVNIGPEGGTASAGVGWGLGFGGFFGAGYGGTLLDWNLCK